MPAHLISVMPAGTVDAWHKIAPVLPASMYLAGGTGLSVHLQHRISRDLDFMFDADVDLVAFESTLDGVGRLAVTQRDEGTLNGVLDTTKIQFLAASGQRQLAPTVEVAGIHVASVEDIAAMKLKTVLDRGELRDYFDLMIIDRQAVPMPEAVGLFLLRYNISRDDQRVIMLVRSLGYLDDVADDPALPVSRRDIERFWARRTPEIVAQFARF